MLRALRLNPRRNPSGSIEIISTSDEAEQAVDSMLRRQGYEPHDFVTRFTKPGANYAETYWDNGTWQIRVLRVTYT